MKDAASGVTVADQTSPRLVIAPRPARALIPTSAFGPNGIADVAG